MGEETGGSRDDPSPQEVFTAGHFMRPAALLLAVPNHSWWLPVPGGLGRVPPMCGFPVPLCRPHARAAPRPGFINLSSKWGSCENILRAGPSFLMNWPGASSSPPLQQEGCRQLPSPPPAPLLHGLEPSRVLGRARPEGAGWGTPGESSAPSPQGGKALARTNRRALCFFFLGNNQKSPRGGLGAAPSFPSSRCCLGLPPALRGFAAALHGVSPLLPCPFTL